MKYIALVVFLPLLFTLAMLLLTKVTLFAAPLAFIGALDIRARLKDYFYLQKKLTLNNWFRLSRRFKRSACQRNAFKAAAKSRGFNLHSVFPKHRWWHVLPDDTFTKNCPYIKLKFYTNLARGGVR